MVSAVQRSPKTLSMDPLLTAAVERMVGVKGEGLNLMREEEHGGQGLNSKVTRELRPVLLGPSLNAMNYNMLSNLCETIQVLAITGTKVIDLNTWCKGAITDASTESVWGSKKNPYQYTAIRNAFW